MTWKIEHSKRIKITQLYRIANAIFETPISITLLFGALCTSMNCSLFICTKCTNALELADYKKCLEFARCPLQENTKDRNFIANVFFSDRATFSVDGVKIVRNSYLGGWKCHATRSHDSQRKFTLNMWAGIVRDCLLRPYITAERHQISIYLTFLFKRLC